MSDTWPEMVSANDSQQALYGEAFPRLIVNDFINMGPSMLACLLVSDWVSHLVSHHLKSTTPPIRDACKLLPPDQGDSLLLAFLAATLRELRKRGMLNGLVKHAMEHSLVPAGMTDDEAAALLTLVATGVAEVEADDLVTDMLEEMRLLVADQARRN